MNAKQVAEYLTALRLKSGLTYEAVAEKSKRSESTVKNLCTGKTEDPRIDTVAPIVYAMGGSIDEMFNPDKNKDEIKETSIITVKDIYEHQFSAIKASYDEQVNNIRGHYEQHHQDLVENFEKRLADKREINDALKEQLEDYQKSNFIKNIIISIFVILFVSLFILELMHPEHGWLRY